MLRLSVIFSFILLFAAAGYAQKVVVRGKAEAYTNKPIQVWIKKDYISNTEKKLTESDIDSSGAFTLEFECNNISYINLKIEKHVTSLFVQPNSEYDVIIKAPDSASYQNPNIEHDVDILINLKSKIEINALTIDYDKRFDDFLTNEYPSFIVRMPKTKIDSFKLSVKEYYKPVNNPYFKDYITYSIATLEAKTYATSPKIYAEYIAGKPVLYNNPEYFNLFNSLYKGYFQRIEQSRKNKSISAHINSQCNIKGLLETLKTEELTKNDTIAELVVLQNLYEEYYTGTYQQDSILKLVSNLIQNSTIEEHKTIAQNILSSFSKLRAGAPAPFFELPDKNGLTHSLDEIRSKKYVYLTFFEPACTQCVQQMKIINSLQKKYNKHIVFVGICKAQTMADLRNFCIKNPQFSWLLLYDNTKQKLTNDYEIKTYPTYFLISPEGKFIQAPADSPENFIERTFIDLTQPKTIKTKVGDKKNK